MTSEEYQVLSQRVLIDSARNILFGISHNNTKLGDKLAQAKKLLSEVSGELWNVELIDSDQENTDDDQSNS